MLKRDIKNNVYYGGIQPPSGGCVLKLILLVSWVGKSNQPPSGGCVLKRAENKKFPKTTPLSRLRAAVC